MFPERIIEKLKQYIYDSDECINFSPIHKSSGYGYIGYAIDKKKYFMAASRAMYQYINNVKLEHHVHVLHSCDNPCCVNIKHLREGSNQDNMNDKVQRGRQPRGDWHFKYRDGYRTQEAIAERQQKLKAKGTHQHASLILEKANEVKSLLISGLMIKEVAEKLNISHHIIRGISCGRRYKQISISQ